jgi:antitoxin CptB
MDETPAPATLDVRRRRLLFRATHRGTRENDLLVGGFVSSRIAGFSECEMDALDEILELPDPAVSDWLTGRSQVSELPDNVLFHAMREAALLGEGVIKTR